MLKALVLTLTDGFEAALILGILVLLAGKNNKELLIPLKRAALLAAITGPVSAYLVHQFGDKELHLGLVKLTATLSLALFFASMARGGLRNISLFSRVTVFGVVFSLLTVKAIDISLFPTKIFVQTTSYLNTELLLKYAGGLSGLLLSGLFGLVFVRINERFPLKSFSVAAPAVLLLLATRQTVDVAKMLFVKGFLPLNQTAMSVLIPFINNYSYFFDAMLIAGGLVSLEAVFRKQPGQWERALLNPGEKRKLKAASLVARRWARAGISTMLAMVILLGTNYVYANRTVKLLPAEPVTAQQGMITLPLDQVNDGKLHRYGYTTPDGIEMRFIVIHKGSGVYGVGLDACEICGTVGYYQKGENVICLNCNVIINIPTIGFPGGCNPIPLPYEAKNNQLVILEQDLLAKEEIFDE